MKYKSRAACYYVLIYTRASLVAQRLKHLPAMCKTKVRSQVREDPREKELTTHFSILAWRIPWMEEIGGLQSMGFQRVRHDWATSLHFNIPTLLPNRIYINSDIWHCLTSTKHDLASELLASVSFNQSKNIFSIFSQMLITGNLRGKDALTSKRLISLHRWIVGPVTVLQHFNHNA